MLVIRIATPDDVDSIYDMHLHAINQLAHSDEIGATTFLDKRSRRDIAAIVQHGESWIVTQNDVPVAYILFKIVGLQELMGQGCVVTKPVQGLGLQRMMHVMVGRKYKISTIVSKYNSASLRNLLALGYKCIKAVNEHDNLYER